MKLISGLGNPGKVYVNTRHNLGFEIIDRLARIWGISVRTRRLKSKIGAGYIEGEQVILAKPLTYMNLSGQAIKKLVDYYRLNLEDILIVCDDVNLKPGQIRIRPGGSHGGHHGLLSIIENLETQDFARLRIGVGRDEGRSELSEYVLSAPDKSQQPLLEEALELALEAIGIWVKEGIVECMNRYNKR